MKNKKTLKIGIAGIVILCIIIAAIFYIYDSKQIYGGNGIYYTQQETGEYLQFNKDKTFSFAYNPDNAKEAESNVQAEILTNGTWKKSGNKITLTFSDNDTPVILAEKDGYLYRENKVFKGKTSDAKLLNNRYLLKETEDRSTVVLFFKDGTMAHEIHWGKDVTIKNGKYTRTDNIITVRYNDESTTAERYLVLETGVVKDIYSKKLP